MKSLKAKYPVFRGTKACLFLLFITSILWNGCSFSFKGTSIASNIKTYYVEDFILDQAASIAPADLDIIFTNRLINKIRDESSLNYDDENPDIIFSGNITRFTVNPAAPIEGNTTLLNRLDISAKINYEVVENEKDNWTKNYTEFEDFPSDQDLGSVQDGLIEIILDDMLEKVFNDAFSNW